MEIYDYPIQEGNNVPDPCKFLATLYEIWFHEHGAEVTVTVERCDGDQKA